ncbi:PREDICTED: tRNA (guanine(26)-N(2))-dimethyltransferase isoform X1 [Fragaria vesca subsp. vesca]|uniref:tRNA (guanine(26)-N(2))-dimethyltransferase isoform X1 n=1 Tax=Fragaria vesca subsp. vesca TaxID=101020 RepID=UPI0002C32319|nr:PREDICTED: tRNA (guanine(26)-N(2))-dimethyltransferase isoform X1 [Fragaria vesca subsp. vesca]
MSLALSSPKTLSPFSFLCNPKPNPQNQIPKFATLNHNPDPIEHKSEHQTERGLKFDTGDTFFRHESATGRDLGVLAATLYKKSRGKLRVLDALCGCGVRSLRYLVEAEADFVLANDGNVDSRDVITANLSQVEEEEERWKVTLTDANRIMTECYMNRDFYDLIDIDSFGSDSSFLRSAINALRMDGLLYVTSTDGFSSGGRRPQQTLAAYGAYVRPMPYSNELGLRMLIGGVVRVASVMGYRVVPLFSYYSYHGPVFRVMLRVIRGKLPDSRHYGFISYCRDCGNSQEFSWEELGRICCPCSDSKVSVSLVVSGPLWTGPLHDAAYITDMLTLAKEWGWASSDTETDLDKLLNTMVAESDPRLPFGFINLDEVASRAKVNSPALKAVVSALQKEGYAVSRSHIESNALKTNCPMSECIRIAQELQQ